MGRLIEIYHDNPAWINPATAAERDFAPSREDCLTRLHDLIAARHLTPNSLSSRPARKYH